MGFELSFILGLDGWCGLVEWVGEQLGQGGWLGGWIIGGLVA